MRKYILLVLVMIPCVSLLHAQEVDCSRKASFGNRDICLPKIQGYVEGYTDPNVKQLADATEVPINMVLGFYLNDRIYDKRDSLGLISFDDYFKIYGTKEIQDYKADYQFLDKMEALVSENFIVQHWDDMSKEIGKLELPGEVGVPTVIDKYRINKESFTFVMLTKYDFEGMESYTLAMTINGYLKNERLIWMAYYLNYEGQETIEKLKKNSDSILSRLSYR